MLVSTRGRYALRVMLDMAEQGDGAWLRLSDIAQRQQLSKKYLESIISTLARAGLVEGQRGKGGGYRLARKPCDYSVGEILRLAEGSLAPVSCLEAGATPCPKAGSCRTLPVWEKLESLICGYLDEVTLTSLLDGGAEIGGCPSVKK